MTHKERVIVSAYTGYVMCEWEDIHRYIEEKLGMPVWAHELADDNMFKNIQDAVRTDFLALCANRDADMQM